MLSSPYLKCKIDNAIFKIVNIRYTIPLIIIARISIYDILTAKYKGTRPALCELDKQIGTCIAAKPRFYFNKNTGLCEEFTYEGCNGNENMFKTRIECEKTCQGKFHLLL